jgi:Xaa-Pro aminopeptidase
MRNVHALVLEAQTRGRAALRPGVAVREVDEAARSVIVAAGLGECFSHGLGHGIGLSIHEAPRLSFRSEEILEIGDVVTVEPGVYLEGRGGVRVEDNYLIEENGAVCLTESLPREIFVI